MCFLHIHSWEHDLLFDREPDGRIKLFSMSMWYRCQWCGHVWEVRL